MATKTEASQTVNMARVASTVVPIIMPLTATPARADSRASTACANHPEPASGLWLASIVRIIVCVVLFTAIYCPISTSPAGEQRVPSMQYLTR